MGWEGMVDRARKPSCKLHAIPPTAPGGVQTRTPRTFYESQPKKMPTRGTRRQRTPCNKGTTGDEGSVVVRVVRRAVVAIGHAIVVVVTLVRGGAVVVVVSTFTVHGVVLIVGRVMHAVVSEL